MLDPALEHLPEWDSFYVIAASSAAARDGNEGRQPRPPA